MTVGRVREYLENIPAIQAELSLVLADVILLPNMKDSARRKAFRRWKQAAGVRESKKVVPPAVLGVLGIGVQFVKGTEYKQ